jgi:hypothetical protein
VAAEFHLRRQLRPCKTPVHPSIRPPEREQRSRRLSLRWESTVNRKAWSGFCDKADLRETLSVEAELTSPRLLELNKHWLQGKFVRQLKG